MTINCKGNIFLKYKFQLNMVICKRVVKLEAKNLLPPYPNARKKKYFFQIKNQKLCCLINIKHWRFEIVSYVHVHIKKYFENFPLSVLMNLSYLSVMFGFLLKITLIYIILYCFSHIQLFHKKLKSLIMKHLFLV